MGQLFFIILIMATTDNLYKFCRSIMRKNQSGSLSGIEFASMWNASQKKYQQDLLGRFQRANNGKEGMNTGLIQNETIIGKLSPFIILSTISVSGGIGTKPGDLAYRLGVLVNGVKAVKINHNQKSSVLNSVIDPPSVADNKYYYVEYATGYSFLPSSVASAELNYVALPTDIVWGYSFDGQGRQIPDPASSTNPLWADPECYEITERMFKEIGVALSSDSYKQFADSVINTGN